MSDQKIAEMTTVIRWNTLQTPPENARYILVRYRDNELGECTFGFGSFENGIYSMSGLDGSWHDLRKRDVLGWAYPIYEETSR